VTSLLLAESHVNSTATEAGAEAAEAAVAASRKKAKYADIDSEIGKRIRYNIIQYDTIHYIYVHPKPDV